MIFSHIIGHSKIGGAREMKLALEGYWNTSSKNDINLIKIKYDILLNNWEKEIKSNINYLTVGDFSYYDFVLETIYKLGCLPERFKENDNYLFEQYFSAARGLNNVKPMEMTKWFNTNYHYLVPEFSLETTFNESIKWLINDIIKAKTLNYPIKVVLLGPFTLLKLGKVMNNNLKNRLLLLPDLVLVYIKILNNLKILNVELIQIDEPILSLNISKTWINSINSVYCLFSLYFSNIILTTYFGEIKNYFNFLLNLNIGLHIDLINNDQVNYILENFSKENIISLGLIDGKNIWKSNLEKLYYVLNKFISFKKLFISTSCSLMHVPININFEKNLNESIFNWISFGDQKIKELKILKNIFIKDNKKLSKDFLKNTFYIEDKKKSKIIFNKKVQFSIKKINNFDFLKRNDYIIRKVEQESFLKLPLLPTTTIGSFPQTNKIRKIRYNFKMNLIKPDDYKEMIENEIKLIINKQVEYDLDVLVHGEVERNDMVEYFAESLKGFLTTKKGWVQSYGSRYVKPPIIYGDVYSEKSITVNWIKFAQSLTIKPVKGMLTGPITMFKWSFSRDDQPNYITCLQLSIFLRNEVLDLENNNIKIIQIDEPAIREYLPLKKDFYNIYFSWSTKIFLFSCNKVKNKTQIHTHVCYSDFKNILKYIKNLDVDVISIETSRSNMSILPLIKFYPNSIGLGIYDIHSENKLNIDSAIYLTKLILGYIDKNKIWINPDCGLKTRKWYDIDISIKNMIKTAKLLR